MLNNMERISHAVCEFHREERLQRGTEMSGKNPSGRQSSAVICAIAISAVAAILMSLPVAVVALDRPVGRAVQFGIGSDLTLSHFTGTAISYLHYRDHDRACRTGITFNVLYDAGDFNFDYWTGHQGADVSHDQSYWDNSIAAVCECLWYRGERISMFYGAGPRVSYSSHHDETWAYDLPSDTWRSRKHDDWKLGAGAEGCLGVQWVATKWLAVHAEYVAQLMYRHEVHKQTDERPYLDQHENIKTVTNGVSLSSVGVRFGLSAYF